MEAVLAVRQSFMTKIPTKVNTFEAGKSGCLISPALSSAVAAEKRERRCSAGSDSWWGRLVFMYSLVLLRAVVEGGLRCPPSRLSIYKERQRENLP
jgi:hypothetical protein